MIRSTSISRARWALALGLAVAACGHPTKPSTTTGSGSGSGSDTGSGAEVGSGSDTGSGSGSAEPAEPPGPPPVNVTLAEVGLEADSLDRTADPCTDFYQFACGGWMAKSEIPADRARWGRFGEIDDHNQQVLHDLLEGARVAKKPDALTAKLGAFYGACMDEKAVEKAGVSGLKPQQALINKVKDGKTLVAAVTELHRVGVDVLFQHGVTADLKDSTTNAMWFDSGGLGLPDRDYYLKDDFKDKRTAYQDHLVRLFKLLGKNDAAAKVSADNTFAVEVELAKVTKTAVEKRDVAGNYHPTTLEELAKLSPAFDWAGYLKAIGSGKVASVVLTNPAFMEATSKLAASIKPVQWQDYLTARLVDQASPTLAKKFDDEHFALEKVLTGVQEQKPRWKRCGDATGLLMSEALGQLYVAKAFPGDSKKYANDLYGAIAKSMGEDFGTLDWMTPGTKDKARQKLAKIQFLTGYPDVWKTYDFKVDPKNYAANAIVATAFEQKRQSAKAGKPYDRSEWLMPAFIVNAYYNPSANNTALPAGILQPPFFGADRGVAANFGGIGMVAGHELTHGFDDQGAQFDEEGRLANWWSPDDLKKFQGKGQCVSKQYSTFEALPGKFVNGDLTLGENIADLGGVKMAFHAYRNQRAGADKAYVADGFTEDQQFFLGVGQAWCSKDRPEEALRRLTVDPHSPPKFRVYGALRNLPEFARAFKCAAGTPMNPKNACSVW
ncbi:MAG: M13 family metallopeptidase [Deltaproteobacteria bacterium]|nr:M13 family metallopeptidase [Deltaproteobacteria bacterium]